MVLAIMRQTECDQQEEGLVEAPWTRPTPSSEEVVDKEGSRVYEDGTSHQWGCFETIKKQDHNQVKLGCELNHRGYHWSTSRIVSSLFRETLPTLPSLHFAWNEYIWI